MKKLIILFLFLVISNLSYSQSGNYTTPNTGVKWTLDSLVAHSNGTVTDSNGIYLINDSLYISSTDTISITQNCVIKVGFKNVIDIYGVLKINPPDSVLMTAKDTSAKYIGMRFEDSSDVSVVRKLIMEYGNSIRCLRANILIDSCVIRNLNYNASTASSAINLSSASPTISNCKIYGSFRSAIMSPTNGGCSPVIVNNQIYSNSTYNGNYPQINLGPGGTDPIIIRGNVITGQYIMAGGISVSNLLGDTAITTVIIENNIVKHNRYGIAFTGSNITGVVSGNICDSNNIQNSASLGGSGLNFYSTATTSFQTIKVKRNIVRGNLWGVTIQGNAKPNFGDISAADTNLIGLNQFYGNTNSSQPNIDFFNNTPDSIKAENNYWGTVNLDTIELHIFHKPDSSALGFVDYLPIMTLTPVISPEISTPKSFKLYEAYPNPFNPSTEVKFDVFTASMVSIKVYDITGRLMGGLVNDYRLPGSYKVNLDAGKLGLTSGVYFIQMNAGNFTQTHKALLIK